MAQVPYPPPAAPSADNLLATAKATAEEILNKSSLLVFIVSRKRGTLYMLPLVVFYPEASLLQSYVE